MDLKTPNKGTLMELEISGLRINTNKTEVIWIGSMKYSKDFFFQSGVYVGEIINSLLRI